jgi:hypothetical protein
VTKRAIMIRNELWVEGAASQSASAAREEKGRAAGTASP